MASDLRRPIALAIALAVSWEAVPAHAETPPVSATPTMRETARARMEKGRALRAEGNERGALEAFQQAYELVPVPTTALEVARSLATLERFVESRDILTAIRRMPTSPSDPPVFGDARRAAADLDRVVSARIGTLRVDVRESVEGWAATLDGKPLPTTALAEGVRVDPGEHRVVFVRGDRTLERSVRVAPGANAVLLVELPRATASASPPPAPPSDEGGGGNPRKVVVTSGVVLAGLGAVLAAGGTAFALSAKPDCPSDRCPPERHGDVDRATTWANVATGGFIGLGVGLATIAVGLLFVPHR